MNFDEWLAKANAQEAAAKGASEKPFKSAAPASAGDTTAAVERALQAVEAQAADITGNYAQWRDLGFALAAEFGEAGRDYYHRLSRFHPEYSHKTCDQQFTYCLRSNGSGIGIGTFFHYVKQVAPKALQPSWGPPPEELPTEILREAPEAFAATAEEAAGRELSETMPTFPDSVYRNLPSYLQRVVAPAKSPEEKDLLLLGAVTALSACFPKLYGIYDDMKVFSNINLFVTAPASAGKGRLNLCKLLVLPIHRKLREQAKLLKIQHAAEMAEFNSSPNKDTREKPAKPPERLLFIPANNSSTGAFQLLSDNDGHGLIFETEGDTLSLAFKTDYGNFSDGFRKAFHHETISYYRRTDREYVDIEAPCLSTVLAGTPKQVTSLIPDAENGLFSRFLFYQMNLNPKWKNVFARSSEEGIDTYYLQLGHEFLDLHNSLVAQGPMRVSLSQSQEKRFNDYFESTQEKYMELQPEGYTASVRRMGLICFRIAMVFSALRIIEDGKLSRERQCTDADFNCALGMVAVLIRHSSKVFSQLPEDVPLVKKANKKEKFLEALPAEFNRKDYLTAAERLAIAEKTAQNYITSFLKVGLISKSHYNHYVNNTKEEKRE